MRETEGKIRTGENNTKDVRMRGREEREEGRKSERAGGDRK